jgi:hypothetical protein
MKKAITLSLAMLALTLSATMALAAGGMNMYLDDCSAGSTANSFANPCSGNTDAKAGFLMAGSVVLPSALTSFNVAQVTLDVVTDAATLPDWWRLDGAGCRAGLFTLSFDQNVTPSCTTTLWNVDCAAGQCPIAINQWSQIGNDRLRLFTLAAIGTSRAFPADGTEYGLFSLQVKGAKTTGTGNCVGCGASACIVLQQVDLLQTSAADVVIVDPMANRHIAVNFTGTPICPGGVSAKSRTWGAVKALYR